MVKLVRVKRKRGLPSPAERLYVDVNDGRSAADQLLAGLSLDNGGTDGASSSIPRPRRAKRYRRIIGNMTLLELEAQAFRDGFETGVGQAGLAGGSGSAVDRADVPAVAPANTNTNTNKNAVGMVNGGENEARCDGRGDFNGAKRKQCSMTYAVVKRRREHRDTAAASGTQGNLEAGIELDPLRRLGGGYQVCDLEFTPSTPDVKSREWGEEDEEELYDLYVEEEGDDDSERGVLDASIISDGIASSCAVVYVDDCDFFMPEFDEDREESDGFDSEDSNGEDYFLNDYPDEEDDIYDEDDEGDGFGRRAGRRGPQGFGWDSEGSYGGDCGEESDGWGSDSEEF